MGNKILAIEIMTNLTKICVINNKQKNPKVYQTLLFDTPYDCIEDGYIKDVKMLSETISDQLRAAKVAVNRVIFTIASSKIANREVIIPFVKENKIQDILKVNSGEYFPMDITDYNISHMVLEKVNTKEEKKIRLLLLAAHNNLLRTYYELAAKLNVHIESIDFFGNSAYQLLRKQVYEDTCMTVMLNDQNTLINVLHKDTLILQRTIPYGYVSALQSVIEYSNYSINQERDAYGLLCKKSLLNPQFGRVEEEVAVTTIEAEDDDIWYRNETVREEITESLHYLISNIIRVADYYTSKKQDHKIQKIYLSGLGAKLKGMELLLFNEIGIEVQLINQLRGVYFQPNALMEDFTQSDFLTTIGAVVHPVGMLPKDYLEREQKKSNIQVVLVITILAIITSIVLAFISTKTVEEASEEKTRLMEEIKGLESIELVYETNTKHKQDLVTMDALDGLNYNNNEQLLQLIEDLERKLPTNTSVLSMRSSNQDLIMDMTVDSIETAAMVLMQLKTVEALENVRTASIQEQVDEYGRKEVSFSVTARYQGVSSIDVEAN